jgi:hypothetical protein
MGEYTFGDVYNKEMEVGYTYEWTRFWAESGIAKIRVSRQGLEKVSFIPTLSLPPENGQPKILPPDDPKFAEIRDHLKWASSDLAGAPEFSVQEEEIRVYEKA